mmetsp:Transcript_14726/g.22454  ORF Transcript_14726/g.22454 Transcript_14726/m.22454 type:complete len:200 (-) Transcript_14726:38-637(-)
MRSGKNSRKLSMFSFSCRLSNCQNLAPTPIVKSTMPFCCTATAASLLPSLSSLAVAVAASSSIACTTYQIARTMVERSYFLLLILVGSATSMQRPALSIPPGPMTPISRGKVSSLLAPSLLSVRGRNAFFSPYNSMRLSQYLTNLDAAILILNTSQRKNMSLCPSSTNSGAHVFFARSQLARCFFGIVAISSSRSVNAC